MDLRKAIIFFFLLLSATVISAQSNVLNLDYFISKGIGNNPSIKEYQNTIEQNNYDSLLVRISRRPQINGTGQLITSPVINGYGYDEAITNGNTFSAVVCFSQDLFVGKSIRNQFYNIRLRNQSLKNASKVTANELKRDITSQYIIAWAVGQELKFEYDLMKLLEEQDQIVRELITKAVYHQTDYLSLQIEIADQKMNINKKRIEYTQGLYDLNRICGINDTANYILADPVLQTAQRISLNSSPLKEKFMIDSLINCNEVEMTRIKYKPKLSWYADAGLNNTNPSLIQKNFGFSAGLSFSMPLNTGKEKKTELAKIDLNEKTRALYVDYFTNQFSMRVYQIGDEIKETDSLLMMAEKQIERYNDLISADKLLIQKGSISIVDFITILKSYLTAMNDISALKAKVLVLENEMNYWMAQ